MIAKEKYTRIIALLLALLMIFMNIIPVTSLAINQIDNTNQDEMNPLATPTVTLSSNVSSVTAGQTIYIDVCITGAAITSFTGKLSYDTSIFQAITSKNTFQLSDAALSGSYGDWSIDSYNSTTKIILVTESSGNYYTLPNGGTLFRIPLTVLQTTTNTTVGFDTIQVDHSNGTVAYISTVSLALPTTVLYNLSVNPNGGTWNGSTSISVVPLAAGASQTIANPTRTGYTFTGWTLAGTGSTISGTNFTMGTANATLTANWTATSYNLIVNPSGGTWSGSTSNQTFPLAYNETKDIPNPTRTGYTFNGWTVVGSGSTLTGTTFKMGAANATLTANWTAITYTLTVNPNGGIWNGYTTNQTYSLVAGETKTLASPTKSGYMFGGWSSSDPTTTISGAILTMGTANTTITAIWTATNYTLTINPQGGTYNGTTANTTVTGSYGSTTLITEAVPPTGYTVSFDLKGGTYGGSSTIADKVQTVTFNYWKLSGIGGWTQAKSGTFTFQADATLNANYTRSSIALPGSPTKAGYTFDGWYTTDGTPVGTGTYVPSVNTTLEARWSEVTYNITYSLNGGTPGSGAPTTYSPSTLPLAIPSPTKVGYTFSSWTVAVSGGSTTTQSPGYSIPVGTVGNVSFTANWTANTYHVEYVANGGTGTIPNTTHTYGTASNLTKNINGATQLITRIGYNFKGWATVAGATIAEYADGQSVTTLEPTNNATKKLYAVWEAIGYNITYNYDGGGAIPANPTTYSASNLPLVLNTPTKTGYIFSGWTGTNITSIVPTYTIPTGTIGDLTFIANWTPISYTVIFDANGGSGTMTPNTKIIKYDESYTIPTSGYTKIGYILKGWSDVASATTPKYGLTDVLKNLTTTNGTNITLYAVWGTQAYNITYTGGGTASPANPTTYDVTALPIALNAPTRLGYKFDGWTGSGISTMTKTYTIPAGTTGDLTFTANWTPNSYYILYKAPDATSGSTTSSTHKYDIAQALTANSFTKTGYTFAGWSTTNGGTTVQYTDRQNVVNLSNTDGTTITLYAVWTANGFAQYTIQYYKNDGSGTYTLADVETQSAVIGTQVTAPSKSYSGFAENTTYPARLVTGIVLADGSLVLKRYYDKDSINVTFLVNNPLSSVSPGSKGVTTGQAYGTLPIPTTVDGYEFQGWYAEPTFSIKVDASTLVTAVTDHYLYAKWKKTKVTVTYETTTTESNVTPKTQDVTIGLAYGTLPTPTERTGYTFDGWYTDISYSNKISSSTIVTQTTDHTVYAKWKPIEYRIIYENLFDASNPNPVKYTALDSDIILTSPIRTGYNFIGWYSDSALTQKITTIDTAEQKDITIYAKWEKAETNGQVIYYVKNSFENDPSTEQNTFEHFEDAKRYCDQLFLTQPVVVWDANGDIVYDPSQKLFLKSERYYIGDFKDVSLKEWETGDKYLFNVNAGTTIAAFIANLKTNGSIKIYDKNHVEITDTTKLVGTGMQIVDTKGNESITLDIIVKGDVDGNGELSITDLSTLNKYLTGNSAISGIYLKAADMDLNGKVSITDLSVMNQTLVSYGG